MNENTIKMLKNKYKVAKPYIDKGWNIAIQVLYALLLSGVILCLSNSTQEIYQTLKDIESAKALMLFSIFLFVLQRVRLINWQSAVVTLIYAPVAKWYMDAHQYGLHLETRDKYIAVMIWILCMIIVDMIVYKKYNVLAALRTKSIVIYLAMAVSMIAFRNNRHYPLALAMPVFLLYLIPVTKMEWQKVVNAFCNGWFIAFFVILYRSITENPYQGGRWYGCYVNIGALGMFLGCVFVVALYRILRSKERWGIKSIPFIFHCVLMIPVVIVMFMVNTRTLWVGIILMTVIVFILGIHKKSLRQLLKNCARVAIVTAVFVAVFILAMLIVQGVDLEKLSAKAENNYILAPIEYFVEKSQLVLSDKVTFNLEPEEYSSKFVQVLDSFTSGRIIIAKRYSEKFNFTGNVPEAIQVGNYLAVNAHNQYVQTIYEHGILAGILFIGWLIYSLILAIVNYFKTYRMSNLIIVLWLAMLTGLMTGEMAHFYFPGTFMTLILLYPQMTRFIKSPSVQKETKRGNRTRKRDGR